MHGKHAAMERTLDKPRNGRVPKAEHALYPENMGRETGKKERKARSLKARASRNSDVAFDLETTAHEWKLFTWRPRLAGVLPHGVCSYHEISEAASRSPVSRFSIP